METLDKILALIGTKYPSDAAFESKHGLKPKTVYEWKRKRSKSYMDIVVQIATDFNVTTDYLLGVEVGNRQENAPERDDKLRLIARRITEIPEKDREKVLAIFEATLDTFLKKDNDEKNKR